MPESGRKNPTTKEREQDTGLFPTVSTFWRCAFKTFDINFASASPVNAGGGFIALLDGV